MPCTGTGQKSGKVGPDGLVQWGLTALGPFRSKTIRDKVRPNGHVDRVICSKIKL